MEYTYTCPDGFMVKSHSKDEVANVLAMHIVSHHPKEKISMNGLLKSIKQM